MVECVAQVLGQHRADLGQHVGGACELAVGALVHPTRAQRQRGDLLLAEHQGRQHEARPQYVADARLAIDVGALGLLLDVAMKRAQRHASASADPLTGWRWRRST